MSFDTDHHLAAKTIGLAPLVRLLANVQKTGQSEEGVDPYSEVVLMHETVRDRDYRGYFWHVDSGTTLPWGEWQIIHNGTEEQSHEKIFGGGLKILTTGSYQREDIANTVQRNAIANLPKNMTCAFWLKAPHQNGLGVIAAQSGSWAIRIHDGRIRFTFLSSSQPASNLYIDYTPDVWTHYAVTFDLSRLKVYKNAEQVHDVAFQNLIDNGNNIHLLTNEGQTAPLQAGTEIAWLYMCYGGQWDADDVSDDYVGLRHADPYTTSGAFKNIELITMV